MVSVFSVTGGRQNFSQMVFEDILEFLNDIHGSRDNSSRQTNTFFSFFFYFPMHFAELSFSQCYTLQSMSGQCEKTEQLCSFDKSESGKSSMQGSLMCLPSLYLQKFFFVWWLFFYMIGQVMTWVFFKCLPARELVWQQIHLCLVFIST